MDHKIRLANIIDSENILKIYEPYITNTAITFETKVPAINEFQKRVEKISEKYPFLVYEIDKKIVGYAYSSQHRERDAYRYNVDVSIYVLSEYHGKGIAYKLYDCLFKILNKQGFINAYAAYTEPNIKSMKFHQKFGFQFIATYKKTGYKFGQWHDVTWLQKIISENDNPREILGINDIPIDDLEKIFQ